MAGPTLVGSNAQYSGGNNSNTLTSAAFTPSAGDVIVVKATTWDTATTMSTPTGGGLTYTQRKVAAPGGFNGYVSIWTAVATGSEGSMTVASTPSGTCQHMLVVERWSGAQLAGTPASNSTVNGSGAPSANITTTAADSIVTWASVDLASQDPASRAYRLSATEDGLLDAHVGTNSVHYAAYAAVATASTVAMGMTAPSSQTWVLAGIEVQASAGGSVSIDAALSDTATLAASATVSHPIDAARSDTATLTGSATVSHPIDAALSDTATLAASATVSHPANAALTATSTVAATLTVSHPLNGDLTITSTRTASAGGVALSADATSTATLAAGAAVARPANGDVASTSTRTASLTISHPLAADLVVTSVRAATTPGVAIEPGNLTASGRPASTLTASAQTAVLTASGRP